MYRARYGDDLPNQAFGAEAIIDAEAKSRTELDEPAMKSHERASAAADGGHFDGQILAALLIVGVPPMSMLDDLVPATRKVLEKAGLGVEPGSWCLWTKMVP